MYQPKSPHTRLAMDAVIMHLEKGSVDTLEKSFPQHELRKITAACFVSLHHQNGQLRGCIGTLSPVTQSLFLEIIRNACSAAFNDYRFSPVTLDELPDLEFSVDVLSEPEKVNTIQLLDPAKYGIIVKQGFSRAVLLPNLSGVDTIEKQLEIVRRKAGISVQTPFEKLEVFRFTAQRFH